MAGGKKLLGTTDSLVWAEKFLEEFAGSRRGEVDKKLMMTWFANAIEAGKAADRRERIAEDAPFSPNLNSLQARVEQLATDIRRAMEAESKAAYERGLRVHVEDVPQGSVSRIVACQVCGSNVIFRIDNVHQQVREAVKEALERASRLIYRSTRPVSSLATREEWFQTIHSAGSAMSVANAIRGIWEEMDAGCKAGQ